MVCAVASTLASFDVRLTQTPVAKLVPAVVLDSGIDAARSGDVVVHQLYAPAHSRGVQLVLHSTQDSLQDSNKRRQECKGGIDMIRSGDSAVHLLHTLAHRECSAGSALSTRQVTRQQ